MDSSRDPFAIAALAGAGTLVGHELGYLAETGASSGHDYFALLAPLALAGAVLAVWAAAVSVLKKGATVAPSTATLAAAQTVLYLGFEIGERTIGATDSALISLPVVLGLLAQPLVAWLAVHALKITSAVIAGFVRSTASTVAATLIAKVRFIPSPPTFMVGRSAPARAPPLFF